MSIKLGKRSADEISTDSILINDGDFVSLMSMNFPSFMWGFRPGDSCLSIIRPKKYHQLFEVVYTTPAGKSVYLRASGGSNDGSWLSLDEDSSEIILSQAKTPFVPEFINILGTKYLVRIRTKEHMYIRHSNYRLRGDKPSTSDHPWMEDSLWLLTSVIPDTVSTAPPSPVSPKEGAVGFNRSLFIHVPSCFSDPIERETNVSIFHNFIQTHLSEAVCVSRVAKDVEKATSYSLQGAGGMGMSEAGASAISMMRPGPVVSDELMARIEAATTVKSRGGMQSFSHPTPEVSAILRKLASLALREMKSRRMFGMVPSRKFKMELGFCEWVSLPNGSEIIPHRDGGNDCDVAAIFCFHNVADCTVEETTITLEEGGMYIFEPQKYVHSVGKPQLSGPRHVVALRFFRTQTL